MKHKANIEFTRFDSVEQMPDVLTGVQPVDNADKAFSPNEMKTLKALAKLMKYDEVQKAFVIENGDSRIVARHDGILRIEGKTITNYAKGTLRLNAAQIELN